MTCLLCVACPRDFWGSFALVAVAAAFVHVLCLFGFSSALAELPKMAFISFPFGVGSKDSETKRKQGRKKRAGRKEGRKEGVRRET